MGRNGYGPNWSWGESVWISVGIDAINSQNVDPVLHKFYWLVFVKLDGKFDAISQTLIR